MSHVLVCGKIVVVRSDRVASDHHSGLPSRRAVACRASLGNAPWISSMCLGQEFYPRSSWQGGPAGSRPSSVPRGGCYPVEGGFAGIVSRRIRRGGGSGVDDPQGAIRDDLRRHDASPTPFADPRDGRRYPRPRAPRASRHRWNPGQRATTAGLRPRAQDRRQTHTHSVCCCILVRRRGIAHG